MRAFWMLTVVGVLVPTTIVAPERAGAGADDDGEPEGAEGDAGLLFLLQALTNSDSAPTQIHMDVLRTWNLPGVEFTPCRRNLQRSADGTPRMDLQWAS